jgi:WD40 repeat protein
LQFWSVDGEGVLQGSRARFSKKGKLQTVLCCAFTSDGSTLTGMSDGKVYRWSGKSLVSVHSIRGWKHAVCAIVVAEEPGFVIVGGRKGLAFLSLTDLSHQSTFGLVEAGMKIQDDAGRALSHTPSGKAAVVKSLAWRSNTVLIGTSSSQIFELLLPERQLTTFLQGHCSSRRFASDEHSSNEQGANYLSEVVGLAAHPTMPQYITSASDGTLRTWNIEHRECTALRPLPAVATAIAYTPDGSSIAVGGIDGSLYMLDALTLSLLTNAVNNRAAPLTGLRFAPDGRTLAVASQGTIDLYDAVTLDRTSVCKGHAGDVMHMDWASDSTAIRSTSSAKELLFWNALDLPAPPETASTMSAESTRDLSWLTTTCEFGWTVQGIRPPEGGDATAITCCDSNHQGSVVAAAGGASGGISLFALPCVDKGGAIAKVSDCCHSDRVSHISWSYDDEVVLSIGGSDLAVCQWRHGRKPRKPDGNATTESTDNIVFESRVDAAKRIQSTYRQHVVKRELAALEDRRAFLIASLQQ